MAARRAAYPRSGRGGRPGRLADAGEDVEPDLHFPVPEPLESLLPGGGSSAGPPSPPPEPAGGSARQVAWEPLRVLDAIDRPPADAAKTATAVSMTRCRIPLDTMWFTVPSLQIPLIRLWSVHRGLRRRRTSMLASVAVACRNGRKNTPPRHRRIHPRFATSQPRNLSPGQLATRVRNREPRVFGETWVESPMPCRQCVSYPYRVGGMRLVFRGPRDHTADLARERTTR